MSIAKPRLSFWQIINMNLGFFGIQYSFGLQQSAVNPIYDFLGASPDQIPILNLAGPLTGLIIQPIIGTLSDKTWSESWGRRKPYFFIGAVLCSIALFLFPFSSALWMAVGLLWILDIGNNTAMEPYRAFVADKLDKSQQATGFQAQSFFTGLGQTLANFSLLAFPLIFVGKTGKLPTWVFASFFLGAFCSVATVWWSMKKTPEIPPTDEEIKEIQEYNRNKPSPFIQIVTVLIVIAAGPIGIYFLLKNIVNNDLLSLLLLPICLVWAAFLYALIKNPNSNNAVVRTLQGVLSPFIEIVHAIQSMPKIMWMLALVYLFQWYALFCYWQNSSKAVAENAFGWHYWDLSEQEKLQMKNYTAFKDGVKKYADENKMNAEEIFKNNATASSLLAAYKDKVASTVADNDITAIESIEDNNQKYEKAVSETGGINGWYNIVTFLVAFLLVGFAKKIGAKYVHFICLLLAGIGFIAFSQVHQLSLFYVAITGFGIGWASMMGIPYLMVVGDIPKEKYGVYMGIINMMIVIPMFIQTTTFGFVMKHHLHNDSSKAIQFAGVLLLIAAAFTLLIKAKKITGDIEIPTGSGH